MKIAKVYNVYFSPTGATKKAAEPIAHVWEQPCEDLDITDFDKENDTYSFSEDEAVYVSVPSYGGRVPQTAAKRLNQMKGQNTPAVVIVAYGNRDYDDTLAELKQMMTGNGFCVIGAVAAVTEHSIVRQYGAGRPDSSDCEELTGFGKRLKEEILAWDPEDGAKDVKVKGKEPFKVFKGSPTKPEVHKSCTGCGLCALKCPVKAISKEHPDTTDKDICISCMRCIQICPQKARGVNKLILSAAALRLQPACSGRKENELYLG